MKLAEDLKKAVLQAAMQGKLTKQLKTDSSVDELLKKIADEKVKLIEEEKIKKEKPLAEITEEEIPFDIPENWRWERWGNLSNSIQYGYNASAISSGFAKMVRISDIQDNKILWDSVPYCEISESEYEKYKLNNTDILFARTGGTVGKSVLVSGLTERSVYAGYLIRSHYNHNLNPRYLKYFMECPLYWNQLTQGTTKGCQPNCNGQTLSQMIVPLPPIEEQQRIVEKLNQILPLIDEYGKEEDELITLCQKFPEEMKKSVLQSAMQGKLTKQLETDSSVDELLKKIADEKAKLIEEGKIKKEKPLAEITEEEIPFDIPENWRWEKLQRISTYGQPKKKKTSSELTDSDWVLDLEDIERDTGRILNKASIKTRDISGEKIVFAKNDILYSKLRPYLKKNLVAPDNGVCTSEIVPFNTFGNICNEFINQYLRSPFVDSYINSVTYGMKMPRVGTDTMLNLIVPLPPIEEQQRIVEKLNTILPIIDSMAVYGTKKKAGRPKQEEALAFISSLLGTQKSTDSKPVTPEILELTTKAKEELPAIVKKYADLMGVTYNRITIRHQKTRWGSCTKTGNLSFNCLIMKMPENVRDYVIIHELAHRKELNHNINFWTIVNEYCPWYKNAKLWLKNNGNQLMENENA